MHFLPQGSCRKCVTVAVYQQQLKDYAVDTHSHLDTTCICMQITQYNTSQRAAATDEC